jgi:hypothetical protein
MHFSAELNADGTRKVDEAKTKSLLTDKYEVEQAPPGVLGKFMIKAGMAGWSRDKFEQRLEVYNEDVKYARFAKTLAGYKITPNTFLKYTEDFVDHYRDEYDTDDREEALRLLHYKKGEAEWKGFEGYSVLGIDFLELVVSVMEDVDDAEENLVAIQAYKEARKKRKLPEQKRPRN